MALHWILLGLKTEEEGKMQIRTESEAHSEQWCQIYDTTVRELGTFCFA